MKKTLLISEIFPPTHGGSGRWFWELYSRLPRNNYFIAAGQNKEATAFDQTHDLTIARINLSSKSWGIKSLSGLKFYWQAFKSLRTLIKKNEIKAIHCGRCIPEGVLGYIFNKLYGIPYLCYIHGEDIETALTSREIKFIVSKVLHSAQYLICNSQNSANLLVNKWAINKANIITLHPGVDTSQFVPADKNNDVLAQLEWGDRPVILTVGRLQKRKGQDILIKALPEIIKKQPDILYCIIGSGNEEKPLKQLVTDLQLEKHVQFLLTCSDQQMIDCYQQCSLFVLPNRTLNNDIEGFGMVLVEAQSCAKVVIAGDSGGTAETMLQNETGFIVDCTTPTQLATIIPELLSDKERLRKMGEQGRQHVVAQLDWEVHTEKAKKIFSDLIK